MTIASLSTGVHVTRPTTTTTTGRVTHHRLSRQWLLPLGGNTVPVLRRQILVPWICDCRPYSTAATN